MVGECGAKSTSTNEGYVALSPDDGRLLVTLIFDLLLLLSPLQVVGFLSFFENFLPLGSVL